MFCSNCGKELTDGARFCSYCGSTVGAASSSGNVNNNLPEVTNADLQKAEALRDKAKQKLDKEKYDEVLDLCGKSLDLNPNDDVTWFFAGIAADGNGDHDNAIKYFSNSIELDDNESTYYFWRGSAYYELEDYDNALENFSDAIKRDHSNANYYNMRGNTYCCLDDFQNGISDFQKALKLKPNDKAIKENLLHAQEALEEDSGSGGGGGSEILRGIGSFLGGAALGFLSALSDDDDDDDD